MTTNTQQKWQQFEALKQIKDPFKYKVAENLLKNELGGQSNGYQLDFAGTTKSGWSFGGNQMDVANNKDAAQLLKDIYDHQYGQGAYSSIKSIMVESKVKLTQLYHQTMENQKLIRVLLKKLIAELVT